MKKTQITYIRITKENRKRLARIKNELDMKALNDAVSHLLDIQEAKNNDNNNNDKVQPRNL